MERSLNIITLEIKKKNFVKNLVISILPALLILLLAFLKNKSFDIPFWFIKIVPYFVLANGCFLLGQEFSNKTDKMIFTGIFTRNEIIISKIINLEIISFILFIIYEIITIFYNGYMGKDISSVLNAKNLFNNLYVFLLYAFTLTSFIMLVSTITSNPTITGIVTYVFYFELMVSLLTQVLFSTRASDVLKCIVRNLPFYVANTGFNIQKYTFNQSIIMIGSGCIFLILTSFILNKRNL